MIKRKNVKQNISAFWTIWFPAILSFVVVIGFGLHLFSFIRDGSSTLRIWFDISIINLTFSVAIIQMIFFLFILFLIVLIYKSHICIYHTLVNLRKFNNKFQINHLGHTAKSEDLSENITFRWLKNWRKKDAKK